jgi:uncharacterized membrane protein
VGKHRLEAFSDGVLAILITILVLELKVPHGTEITSLAPLLPVFLTYVLSFAYLGIYWNNHHHLLQLCSRVTGAMLWANLVLLFWLSLVPFATGWMGENHFATWPTALYGVVLLMAALSYTWLQTLIIRAEGPESLLAQAVQADWKGKLSLALYVLAIAVSLRLGWLSLVIYVVVALIWLVPDRRIEKIASHAPH